MSAGASQGKLQYALALFGLNRSEVSDGRLADGRIVYHLESAVRSLLEAGIDAEAAVLSYADANPDRIFLCDEVGGGLVPADPFERAYRDAVGRICVKLAGKASRVHRVFCGIGTVIKDA